VEAGEVRHSSAEGSLYIT